MPDRLAQEQARWLENAGIRARIKTAGSVVPDPLRDEVFGEVVESAEGVTTFAGYAARAGARERVRAKVEALREAPASDDGSSTSSESAVE